MLTGVIEHGTASRALGDLDFAAAGKTGTNDRYRDAWFVGYTPQLTAAVWMGDPNAQVPVVVDGVSVVGGSYPARIWGEFMRTAMAGVPAASFIAPDESRWPRGGYISERGRSAYRPRPTTTTTAPAPPPVAEPPERPSPPSDGPRQPRPPNRPRPPGGGNGRGGGDGGGNG
jgi:penicillin-binding protein 1A